MRESLPHLHLCPAHWPAATAFLEQSIDREGTLHGKVPPKAPLGGTLPAHMLPGTSTRLCPLRRDAEAWVTGGCGPIPQSSGSWAELWDSHKVSPSQAAHLEAETFLSLRHLLCSPHRPWTPAPAS